MLTWPHPGFHVHTAVWVLEDDQGRPGSRALTRNPVALERLIDDRTAKAVTYRVQRSLGCRSARQKRSYSR